MLRTGKLVGGATRARATRALNWKPTVNHFTPAGVKQWWASLDSELSRKKAESVVAAEIEPIDWAAYEAKIKQPGLVAKLKAEYEAQTFTAPAGASPEALAAEDKRLGNMAEMMRKWGARGQEYINGAQAQEFGMANLKRDAAASWDLSLLAQDPQLIEQFRESYMIDEWFDEQGEKLEAMDWAAVSEALDRGVIMESPPEYIPAKIGSIDTAEWMAEAEAVGDEYIADWMAVQPDKAKAKVQLASYMQELDARKQPMPL